MTSQKTFLLACALFLANILQPIAAQSNFLDPSFDWNGYAVTDQIYIYQENEDTKYRLVQTDNGKLYTFGKTYTSTSPNALASIESRNADGSVNYDFNQTGWLDFHTINKKIELLAMVPYGANDLLVCGKLTANATVPIVARVLSNGQFDPTFGTNGFLAFSFGWNSTFYALAVQPDGKIIAVGSCDAGLQPGLFIVRLNADGTRDLSFADNGVRSMGDLLNDTRNTIFGVKILTDGKILVGGYKEFSILGDGSNYLLRLYPSGHVDLDFGDDGFVFLDGSQHTDWYPPAQDLAIDPDGKIIVCGGKSNDGNFGPSSPTIWRLEKDGRPDSTFNFIGRASYAIPFSYFNALKIQSDGKYLLSKARYGATEITRILPNAIVDPTFGTNGEIDVNAAVPGFSTIHDIQITTDGKVLVYGEYGPPIGDPHYVIARFGQGAVQNEAQYENLRSATLYPNPASTFVNLEVDLDKARTLEFVVSNVIGNEILRTEKQFFAEGKHSIRLDEAAFQSKGIYFVSINSPNLNPQVLKLIVH